MDPFAASSAPAGAYHRLLADVLPHAGEHRQWQPADGPMPAVFVSHGAPPTLDHDQWLRELHDWSLRMPKPRAIVVVSAHWEDAPLALSSVEAGTPLYYDFWGFDPHYSTLKYEIPDASTLAARVVGALADTTPVHHFTDRGLDHGAFIPLMAMYPAADVPVIQMSMPSLAPATLFALGERLRELREEGILIMGSGFMTHSFEVFRNPALRAHTQAFDTWAADAIARSDLDALMDFRAKGPGAAVSHRTDEHYVPLLATLGAANGPEFDVTTAIEEFRFSNSIRSFQVA